jgi:hypothetical protein
MQHMCFGRSLAQGDILRARVSPRRQVREQPRRRRTDKNGKNGQNPALAPRVDPTRKTRPLARRRQRR